MLISYSATSQTSTTAPVPVKQLEWLLGEVVKVKPLESQVVLLESIVEDNKKNNLILHERIASLQEAAQLAENTRASFRQKEVTYESDIRTLGKEVIKQKNQKRGAIGLAALLILLSFIR